ncbi:universal stress protein [Streptomyces sp. NPDC046909]|uniref:universal stress protein n=1 Tax=Streptomyces sp. NPDC046909 TaxID=3155617 RepID=UPI0033C4CF5B
MELPLVVGVDGSPASLVAVDWAADEVARHGLPLRLVHATLRQRHEGGPPEARSERAAAEDILDTAAERARRRDAEVKVSAEAVPEDAVRALLHEAPHAVALVTGAGGRGELTGLLLGSVPSALAGCAPCPMIVVRGDVSGRHERILLGVTDPASGVEAVRFAFREAEARGCVLDAVRAWSRPAHEMTQPPLRAGDLGRRREHAVSELLDAALYDAALDRPAVRVRRATVEGSARKVLLRRSGAADLVIVAARRGHGRFRPRLGRVAHGLLQHAECPVAVVPEGM